MNKPFNIYIRLAIALGSMGIYAALFTFLAPSAGPASSALIVIPMAIVGWFLGIRGSLLFGIATVPLNFFLFRSVGIANSGGIAPHLFAGFAFTLSGIFIGWIRNLMTRVDKQSKELQEKHKILQEEISRRTRAEEKLTHETLHDPLTSLPNRRLFLNRLEHAHAWSKRNPDNLCAVLYIDLDKFKTINDSLGHNTGDQLLIQVADRLKSSVRDIDTVARMGGDEFAILLEAASTPEDVKNIIQRIQTVLAQPYDLKGNAMLIGASIGVVMNISAYKQIDEFLGDADTAMYHAKASGDNQFKVFEVGK
jgi:diguanylate cyclase (GGDEF)-like protein